MARVWLALLALPIGLTLSATEPPRSTRAFTNGAGVGVSGYIHRAAEATRVRVVLLPTLQGREKTTQIDWAKDGVGWEVDVHPGIAIRYSITELIPLSAHEYRHRANKTDPRWPQWEFIAPTRVYRRAGDRWELVASSERTFVWDEGFVLQSGDVIGIREVNSL